MATPNDTPATAAPKKPKWYSREGLSTLVVIPVVVGIMSLMLLAKRDSPVKLVIFGVAVAVGVGLYKYTHPKKPTNAGK